MVVAAYDAPTFEAGLQPDASGDMPPIDAPELPEASDAAAPFVLSDDPSAATDASEPADAEPDPQAALRETLIAELRPQVEAELNARFQQDKAQLQQAIHQNAIRPLQDQVTHLATSNRVLQERLNQWMQDQGWDDTEQERERALLESRQNKESLNTRSQQQQAEAGYSQTVSYMVNRTPQVYAEIEQQLGATGLFTPEDQQQDLQWIAQNLDQHYKALHYQYNGDMNSPLGQWIANVAHPTLRNYQTQRAMQRLAQRGTQAEQEAKTAAAAKAAANREKAAQRGPTSTATGGGGGGAVNPDALVKQAWELHPTDEAARMTFMNNALYANLQPRR